MRSATLPFPWTTALVQRLMPVNTQGGRMRRDEVTRQDDPAPTGERRAQTDAPPHAQAPGRLAGKVALITGGDGPIARTTALRYAREGADIALVFCSAAADVAVLQHDIEALGRRCVAIQADESQPDASARIVDQTVAAFERIDVLVNNVAEDDDATSTLDVTRAQLESTFRTHFFALFDLCRSALPHMGQGSCIINAAAAEHGGDGTPALDAAASQGAIVAFTQSLARQVAWRRVRVNAVLPGPVWTPQVPATYSAEELDRLGRRVPMRMPREPEQISPCFVYLASETTGLTGQVLQPEDCEPMAA